MNEEKMINEQELEQATGGTQRPDVTVVTFTCPDCGRQLTLAMGMGTTPPSPPMCCGREMQLGRR